MVLAAAVTVLAWIIYQRVRHGRWRLPRLRRAEPVDVDIQEDRSPAPAPARAWLEEADALAAQGRYAEAAHHLLFRSIEDIARRRPQLVRPALTSREIAGAEGIPGSARGLFSGIAQLVERSLFGGRPVGADDWSRARAAYSDFLQPVAWRA